MCGAVIQFFFLIDPKRVWIVIISDHACNLFLVPVAEHRDQEGYFGFALRGFAKRMQAIRHELGLQIIEIPGKFRGELIECIIIAIHGGQVDLKIVVKMQFFAFRYDRLLVSPFNGAVDIGSHIERYRLQKVGQIPVEPCSNDRGRQMRDHRCASPPLCLRTLCDVIHNVRIDHRNILDQYCGPTVLRRQSGLLAGKPLLRAVLSEMHDLIRTEPAGFLLLLKPEIERDVLVVRRDVSVVVQHRVVLKPAACRLWRKDHVPKRELWDHEVLVSGRFICPDHDLSWRLPPPLVHLFLPLCLKFTEPFEIRFNGNQGRCP